MKKQLLLFLFALLPMLTMADESGKCGPNVTYTYVESSKTLTIQGQGAMDNYSYDSGLSIPTTTAPWKNYLEQIKEVIIKDGVTSIGDFAFSDCYGLTSVTIGNGVTSIGNYAFYYCFRLTSVTIPNSVTSIGSSAFSCCSGLTSIKVDNENSKYDSRNDCNAIIETASNTLIAGCKNTVISNTVTSIGQYAFRDCSGLTSITIPNSVTSIGNAAFWNCTGLTSVTIGNGVTSIGSSAFSGCSGLTSVTIGNSVTSIGDDAFYGCSGLTSITIPNSVTSIGKTAFRGCSGLTSITIPNSVTSIGITAFHDCSGLTSVTLLCKEIGAWFSGKSSIKEVVIGNEVTSIAQQAFAGCSGLQKVYSKVEDVFTINKNTFDTNTYNNAKLYVPVGKKAVYLDTPWWWSFTNIETYNYSTGIAAPQMGKDAKVVDAYQLNGLKRNGVQRGMNIVRMSDGTTRKVVVK